MNSDEFFERGQEFVAKVKIGMDEVFGRNKIDKKVSMKEGQSYA